MRSKWLLAFVGASAATAVALGAFAAHGLKSSLAPYLLEVFETGVMYQFLAYLGDCAVRTAASQRVAK